MAVNEAHPEVARLLLEAGARPRWELLNDAMRNFGGYENPETRFQMIELLVAKGANVNGRPGDVEYNKPLWKAVITMDPPDLRVGKLLLDHGASVGSGILSAAARDRPEVLAMLHRAVAARAPLKK